MQNSMYERESPTRLVYLFAGQAPGRGKWRNIAMELFNIDVLKDILIDQSVAHIKNNVYTKTYWAYMVDILNCHNPSGIGNVVRKIEATLSGRGLVWPSGSVK
jgi:hypothetical protein